MAALVSCGKPSGPSEKDVDNFLSHLKQIETPVGGAPARLRGIAFFAFETSSIDLCRSLTGPCEHYEGISDCHFKFPDRATNGIGHLDGFFRIELTGRVSTALEGFGHMSAHLCEVEADRLLSVRRAAGPLPNDPLGPELIK